MGDHRAILERRDFSILREFARYRGLPLQGLSLDGDTIEDMDDELDEVLGPQATEIVDFIRRLADLEDARMLPEHQFDDHYSNASIAREAAISTAIDHRRAYHWLRARRIVNETITSASDDVMDVARAAVLALSVRDLVSDEFTWHDYFQLVHSVGEIVGPVHPDDEADLAYSSLYSDRPLPIIGNPPA